MIKENIFEILESLGAKVAHTGSRAICDNVRDTSDDDYVVLLPQNKHQKHSIMLFLDIEKFCDQSNEDVRSGDAQTTPFKRAADNVNLILVEEEALFNLWIEATRQAKEQKLCNDRTDRVNLFHKVIYGSGTEEIPF